jgi:hypothetical protein
MRFVSIPDKLLDCGNSPEAEADHQYGTKSWAELKRLNVIGPVMRLALRTASSSKPHPMTQINGGRGNHVKRELSRDIRIGYQYIAKPQGETETPGRQAF